jgi:hypothetical protein
MAPPVYPTRVSITPGTSSKGGSKHQKHPPAKVALETETEFDEDVDKDVDESGMNNLIPFAFVYKSELIEAT